MNFCYKFKNWRVYRFCGNWISTLPSSLRPVGFYRRKCGKAVPSQCKNGRNRTFWTRPTLSRWRWLGPLLPLSLDSRIRPACSWTLLSISRAAWFLRWTELLKKLRVRESSWGRECAKWRLPKACNCKFRLLETLWDRWCLSWMQYRKCRSSCLWGSGSALCKFSGRSSSFWTRSWGWLDSSNRPLPSVLCTLPGKSGPRCPSWSSFLRSRPNCSRTCPRFWCQMRCTSSLPSHPIRTLRTWWQCCWSTRLSGPGNSLR